MQQCGRKFSNALASTAVASDPEVLQIIPSPFPSDSTGPDAVFDGTVVGGPPDRAVDGQDGALGEESVDGPGIER